MILGRLGAFVVRRPMTVIGLWILTAALLTLMLPSLKEMTEKNQALPMPSDAPSMVANQAMDNAFGEAGSQNILLVVLTDDKGLNPTDVATYGHVVSALRADSHHVVMVQDFVTTPSLRGQMSSADNKAWLLPVGLRGNPDTSQAEDAYKQVVSLVRSAVANTSLTVNFAGPAATGSDITILSDADVNVIETITTAMVLIILLIVYRNPVIALLPVAMIVVSTIVAQGIVSGLAQRGLAVSSQTIVLMTGMMVGAGTDYAVFLLSRYHEFLRAGNPSDDSVRGALTSTGKVLAASAATVGIAFLGMTFTRLDMFSTIGPALAVTVAVGFAAAVTLLPAILTLASRRGWLSPRRDLPSRFWRRSAVNIVRRPVVHLVASLTVLIALAASGGFMRFDYDDRDMLPASAGSNRAYATMNQHFAASSTIPQYLLVRSPHDLQTPRSLADLELMAQRVSQVPDVLAVRGLTRPTGQPLEQAKISYQSGQVGLQLSAAASNISKADGNLNALSQGSRVLADTIASIRDTIDQSLGTVDALLDAVAGLESQFGGVKAVEQIENAGSLVKSLRLVGDMMGESFAEQQDFFDVVLPVVDGLSASPVCDVNPSCVTTRAQLQRLVQARDNGGLEALNNLGRALQAVEVSGDIDNAVRTLRALLDSTMKALGSLGIQATSALRQKLDTLGTGAQGLAQGSQQLAAGVQALVDQTRQMGAGLNEAGAMLSLIRRDAEQPAMAGFFIPPQAWAFPDFKKMAAMTISPDGHTVRYLVESNLNPFSTAAMNQVDPIQNAARSAQPNTSLSDATISLVGIPAFNRDMRAYYDEDLEYIGLFTIVVVFVTLILLLRAIIAPLYLVGSAIVSCLSALGVGVIVFQMLLHQNLSWTVPSTAFIVLVAVGADYNLLLISRIRDESRRGIRSGVIRAVNATGPTITSAGVIFAVSMFGLLFSSVNAIVQMGFVIGVGLLLDTFVVRTVTVPALAALIGRVNWWPSGAVASMRRRRAWRDAITAAVRRGDLSRSQHIRPVFTRRSRLTTTD